MVFIVNLPTTLVEAFRATLEEVTEACLLIHVLDASSPAAAGTALMSGVSWPKSAPNPPPSFLVLNKSDCLPADSAYRDALARRLSGESGGSPTAWVSARTAERLPELLSLIDANLPEDALVDSHLSFPLLNGLPLISSTPVPVSWRRSSLRMPAKSMLRSRNHSCAASPPGARWGQTHLSTRSISPFTGTSRHAELWMPSS